MATLTPVTITNAGVATPLVAASGGGDVIANASGARLRVLNGSGSAVTVTLTGVVPCSQGSTHNVTESVAAGATNTIAIPPQCVNPADGTCAVGYSSVTTVSVGATY